MEQFPAYTLSSFIFFDSFSYLVNFSFWGSFAGIFISDRLLKLEYFRAYLGLLFFLFKLTTLVVSFISVAIMPSTLKYNCQFHIICLLFSLTSRILFLTPSHHLDLNMYSMFLKLEKSKSHSQLSSVSAPYHLCFISQ